MTKRRYLVNVCLFVGLFLGIARPGWASPGDLKEFAFPEIGGWKRSAEIQTFSPKTLYEYIDGAADLYLMYDFQALKVAEYQNEKRGSVTIDVYFHKIPIQAFGIYSQERLPDADFIDVGAQGYVENNALNFLIGPYYVKISSYNTGAEDREILLTFARKMAEGLGEKGSLPTVLSAFPEEGKKEHSEKFINKNFLGYPFLHSALTANYELSGAKFKLFIIESDPIECKGMIQKYLQQIGSPAREVVEGRYTLRDPYQGEIDLDWQGKYIWGTVNISEPVLRSKYLKLFEESLKKNQLKK
ncbi:MAG TPA: DUF6599 family protein [Thermodesulfobacteriota bacterium]|nr:DUF6599 family protein [Thermodesulfobacteriota bacterium]